VVALPFAFCKRPFPKGTSLRGRDKNASQPIKLSKSHKSPRRLNGASDRALFSTG
jgi:hypothetical protein